MGSNMGRVPRWRMGKGVYHVFNRGLNSAWILKSGFGASTNISLYDK